MLEEPHEPVATAVRPSKSMITDVAASIFAVVFLSGCTLGVTELIAHFLPTLGVFIYAAMIALDIFMLLIYRFSGLTTEAEDKSRDVMGAAWFLIVFIIGFGELCRYWNVRYGGFVSHDSGYWDWALYGVAWILDNGLANLGQIFGWSVTNVQAVSFGARTITWLYNVVIEFIAIVAFVRYVPMALAYWGDLGAKRKRNVAP